MPVKQDKDVYVLLGDEDLKSLKVAEQRRAAASPSHEAIAKRAYELFQARGGGHGSDVKDWLAAEGELEGA
ncbi:MAG TPA: DUF2934 domain-containing protein [Planctomycetota bacterium]|nr:DUF2934 domain-containing protein [Planctomycetota bacterium]